MSVEMEKRFMYMFMGLIRNIDERNDEWIDAFSTMVTIAKNLNNPEEVRQLAVAGNREDLLMTLLQAVQIYAKKRKYQFDDFKLLILYIDALCHGNLEVFSSTKTHVKSSEELRLNIVICLKMIFTSLSEKVLDEFYSGDSKTYVMMYQLISTCLDLAEKEKLRTLRISALECIMSISQLYDDPTKPSKVIQFRTAELLANILPGVSRRLHDICKSDEKQGHQITMTAVRCWGRFIARILNDNLTPKDNEKLKFKIVLSDKIEYKKRDEDFYKIVIKNLDTQSENFSTLANHSHPAVRLEVVKTCELFINNCLRNMEPLMKYYISILIKISGDDFEMVQFESSTILNKFLKMNDNNKFIDIVENLFHQFLTTLPRLIINSIDEKSKISTLTLLCEYLRIFTKSEISFPVLDSIDYVNYLLSSLITIVEFDVIDLSLLEDYSFKDFNDVSKLGAPWKKFGHLNEEAHEKICAACHVIGNQITNNGAETIINMLLDRFQTIHEQRKEIVFLLNTIASTPIENSTTNIEYKLEMIENILEVYIDTDHWYLPIKSDSDCESIKEIKSNVIQVCLMTEGIGLAAQALGLSFDRFMRQTLYILLERAGSTQTYVSLAGMNSINMIKNALNFKNVTSLLVNNSDYLRYHIVKKLRYVECNSEVLDVLGFIMRYSTIDILPCMEEIISDALVQSLDKIQYKNWIPFIRLFQIFVKTVAQWQEKDRNLKILLSTSNETGSNDTYDAAKMNQLQSENILTQVDGLREIVNEYDEINEEFKKREQNMTTTEMILEDYKEEQQKLQELKEMDEIDSNIDENNKSKPPLEIQLTNDIMKRSVHFLPSKDENLKILTLDVLTIGVGVLREWEDIILPMVHLIWSPLIGRFKEISNPLIVDRSVILLHTMIQFTDTFLGRRTLPQLSILIKYLKDLAPDSLLKDSKSAYRYTQQYKLQLTLLKYIPEIVKNLKITDVDLLSEIFLSGIPYLSNRQPKPLQENCIRFYKICNEIDKNLITQIIFNDKSIIESKEYELNLKILKSFIEVV